LIDIPFGGNTIIASFDGGNSSSDGGLLLLRELDKRLGLTKRLAGCIKNGRDRDPKTGDGAWMTLSHASASYEFQPDQSRHPVQARNSFHRLLRDVPRFSLVLEAL